MLGTIEQTNWYMRILSPLSSEVKISLINKLSASLMKKNPDKSNTGSRFFDGLGDSWDDGVSPEDEMKAIRSARMSGQTRIIDDF